MDFPRKPDGGIVFGSNELICSTRCNPKHDASVKTLTENRRQKRSKLHQNHAGGGAPCSFCLDQEISDLEAIAGGDVECEHERTRMDDGISSCLDCGDRIDTDAD
jgi:hypothetical protein